MRSPFILSDHYDISCNRDMSSRCRPRQLIKYRNLGFCVLFVDCYIFPSIRPPDFCTMIFFIRFFSDIRVFVLSDHKTWTFFSGDAVGHSRL